MNRKFGRLPPLTTLEGFEAAARLGSFSLAADELGVTQSAISHQMKTLEDHFQLSLFIRIKRTVILTDAGKDFLKTVSNALEALARGRNRLEYYTNPSSVVIATSPAIASKWLVPRYSLLPKGEDLIEPWLYTDEINFPIEDSEIDLAIWYGDGKWPNVESHLLFNDRLSPLCTEGFLGSSSLQTKLENLKTATLLHDERKEDWQSWLHEFNHTHSSPFSGLNFSDPGLLLDSAMAGHGIALGSIILAQTLLNDGKLIQPFNEEIKTADAYYLVINPNSMDFPYVQKMSDWIIEQAQRTF